MIDKCSKEWEGGNGYFTAGAMRCEHGGLDDLSDILHDPLSNEEKESIDLDAYTKEEFKNDIQRLGGGRGEESLVDEVVNESREAIRWLKKAVNVPFVLSKNRQSYQVNGRQKFWGGMALGVKNGGKGLIDAHHTALRKAGVDVWFDCKAIKLMTENEEICGLEVERSGVVLSLQSPSVVLACGGFEASAALRVKHLGTGWEKALVRGTPYNTGDGFELAAAVGAKMVGDWGGCHSTCWDAEANSHSGERELTNQYTKSGYPLGLMINAHGHRFVDEGEDYRNFTYAKFGRAILGQPSGFAFQLWDAKTTGFLRQEEYGDGVVNKIMAQSIEEMAEKLVAAGLENRGEFLSTIQEYNEAAQHNETGKWNPAVKDGLSTKLHSLSVPKTNWALAVDTAPFMAVKVGCGITFTFGGLAVDPHTAGVLSVAGNRIAGLFCAGEIVGGLFYGNYPGGSGLTAGAVLGRHAGKSAAGRK